MHAYIHIYSYTHTHTHSCTQRYKQIHRETHTEKETHRHTRIQRKTQRRTERDTQRHMYRERYTETHMHSHTKQAFPLKRNPHCGIAHSQKEPEFSLTSVSQWNEGAGRVPWMEGTEKRPLFSSSTLCPAKLCPEQTQRTALVSQTKGQKVMWKPRDVVHTRCKDL